MKQFLVFIIFVFSTLAVSAQDFTYGFLVGANAYDGDISGGDLHGGDAYSAFGKDGFPLNIGVFGNYQLNQSIGVKANLFYKGNYRSIDYFSADNPGLYYDFDTYISSIQFQPLFVFDVNKEYDKGFYLMLGPGIDFKLNENNLGDEVNDLDELYNHVNIDALLGFGFTFSKVFSMEFIANYGLSNQLDSDLYETTTVGAYVNFLVNLTPLINK